MRTTIGKWMCAILCVCCASGLTLGAAEGELYAGCMVKITADPAVYPLTIDNIGHLIRRTAVGQKPISELKSDIPADDAIIVEALEPVGGGDPYGAYGAAGSPVVYVGGMETGGGGGMGMMGGGGGMGMMGGGMGGFGGGGMGAPAAGVASGDAPDPAPQDYSEATLPPATGRYGGGRGAYGTARGMGGYGAMGGMGGYGGGYGGYAGESPYGGGRPAETGEPGAVTLFIHLAVDLRPWPEVSGTARQALQAVIENLRVALDGASEQYMQAVDRQVSVIGGEAMQAEKELTELQAALRELSGSRDLSRAGIQEEFRGLRNYLDTATRERVTNAATTEAMAKQLAERRAQLESEMGGDIILEELERMVKMAEEQEAQVQKMVQTGRAGAAEKTLRARIELAKRKEERANSAGGGQAAALNNEMASLAVKAAQLDAEMKFLEQQVDEARTLLEKADTYERELVKLDLARRNMEETMVLRDRMARRFRMIAPSAVVVMGAE